MCSLQEHIERDIRAQDAAKAAAAADETTKPTVESIRQRPPHPVHIPEHLQGIVTEGQAS
ncbi:hypothetical protein SEA_POPPER_60 [Arthrobacter phage Popper]|uniref:Uncharacterized protein n=1 Tax=Arthrobacter phage Popper TaxID=2859633 RepID=A0AAE7WDT9_9CAUD|nr:hypothetical protein QEO78_gp46 [Arthrobacter phage Popper]QYC54977.1 hypothetical protein SEA_POPPER_60 [Arthrobacter phage Popper]